MPYPQKHSSELLTIKQPNILGRIGIVIIKIISNYFWDFVDTFSYKSPKIAALYEKSIGKEYRTEYESFGINKDKKILHIGCGPYPLTELVLVKLFGAHVVGIDNNLKVIRMAQEVIQKKHLEDTVTIELGDGIDYPIEQFDVIIISSCSLPKVWILNHIFKRAKKGCLIVVRELDIATADIFSIIHSHKNVVLLENTHHHPVPFLLFIPWTAISLKMK
ncbi:MAG: class I SAM-dependent methyltransferase [Candidatus Thermoplasmatota archaeon]|nr:class I SAM-dependent methyltransferase [Candidatus Thermoplasmatota archaeon]